MRKKIFSGVQPTGNLHIGNYIGAIKNFVNFSNNEDNNSVFCVVDLMIHLLLQPATCQIAVHPWLERAKPNGICRRWCRPVAAEAGAGDEGSTWRLLSVRPAHTWGDEIHTQIS